MNNKYFAYHGPQNNQSFDFEGGYGVTAESKWKNVKDGDLVYVIQKTKRKKAFEFCGIFKVIGHYLSEKPKNEYYHRFKLEDISKLQYPIKIDEGECGKKLPQKESNLGWSNFKLHFCEQGGSFRTPLSDDVVNVLNDLLVHKTESKFADQKKAVEKKDSDLALSQLIEKGIEVKGIEVSVEAILDQIERNSVKEGKVLKPNWRITTEINIRECWYK